MTFIEFLKHEAEVAGVPLTPQVREMLYRIYCRYEHELAEVTSLRRAHETLLESCRKTTEMLEAL